jgi:thiol-disulfide isomerase/thioredoxin
MRAQAPLRFALLRGGCAALVIAVHVRAAEPPASPGTKAPAAEEVAPDFMPLGIKSFERLALAPHHGKPVLVNFWASDCQPCLTELPDLLALQAEVAERAAVVFVAGDDPARLPQARRMLARRKLTVPSFLLADDDPEPLLAFIDPRWQGELPFTVLYDANHKKVRTFIGAHKKAEFLAALAPHLPPAPPARPAAQP